MCISKKKTTFNHLYIFIFIYFVIGEEIENYNKKYQLYLYKATLTASNISQKLYISTMDFFLMLYVYNEEQL
jgi:hypothetical protein